MPQRINQPVMNTKTQSARKSGSNLGQQIGMGLGAIAGGLAGGPGGAAMGAIQGAGAGAGLGGMIGGAVKPGRQEIVEQSVASQVPVHDLAQQSQQLLDGIRALKQFPDSSGKYMTPLTEAFMESQMELKRRG